MKILYIFSVSIMCMKHKHNTELRFQEKNISLKFNDKIYNSEECLKQKSQIINFKIFIKKILLFFFSLYKQISLINRKKIQKPEYNNSYLRTKKIDNFSDESINEMNFDSSTIFNESKSDVEPYFMQKTVTRKNFSPEAVRIRNMKNHNLNVSGS